MGLGVAPARRAAPPSAAPPPPWAAWLASLVARHLGLHLDAAAAVLLLALLLSVGVSLAVGLVSLACHRASQPDAPWWMRRCSCVGERGAYAVVGVDVAAPPPFQLTPSVLSGREPPPLPPPPPVPGGRGRGRGRGRGGAQTVEEEDPGLIDIGGGGSAPG